MKIATWNVNCGMISDRLAELRAVHDTDIVAMQETSEPAGVTSCHWDGDLKHKGISLSSSLPSERVHIKGESSPAVAARFDDSSFGQFNVLVVWAKPTPTYYLDLQRTLDHYSQFIRERPTVVLGDFNLSVRVQSKGRQFYSLNGRLNHEFDVYSAYHEFTNERFGMETMTTLYHQWGASGCFHCDYIYIPGAWIARLRSVKIPGYKKMATSDHRPVICDFE